MSLANEVKRERQAGEKGVRFLKPRSISVSSREIEEMGLFPGQLQVLTCGEEEMVENTLNKMEIGSLLGGESHTSSRCRHTGM